MKYILTAIVALFHGVIFAQFEAANWYFGENAGIQFNSNTGAVSALTNGRLNTKEGASSISDEQGNLLFYTDGLTVYNKDHGLMDNGSNLYGNPSSTQSAIVVPKPNSSDIYYIFTVGSGVPINGVSFNGGFRYSIVDLSENSGLGKVIEKNTKLLDYSSEKISAVVKDCHTQSIWVITLSTYNGQDNQSALNTFYAYEINDTNINHTPVVSNFATSFTDPRGALKLSPDGTKMVSANMDGGLLIYDFDADTGKVSNQQELTISTSTSNRPYGVEFSSNNRYLYIHASNDYNGNDANNETRHRSALIQYDLKALDISDSQVVLDDRNLFRGALQLGPDGKIYRALSATYERGLPYLGVIQNPNAKGTAAQYRHNAIDLGGKNSTQGLPPFIQSFFNQKIDIIHASDGVETNNLALCTGDTYTLTSEEIPDATYEWTLNGNTISPTLNDWEMDVTKPGYYKVIITPVSGTFCDIKEGEAYVSYYDIPIAHSTSDITNICDWDNDGTETIDLSIKNAEILGAQNPSDFTVSYFETEPDALANTNKISASNAYNTTTSNKAIFARVENNNNTNCFATTSFNITLIPTPTLTVQDLNRCDVSMPYNDGISVFNLEESITSTDASIAFYETNPEGTASANSIENPQHYINSNNNQVIYVRATNDKTGCYTDQTFNLTVTDAPETFDTAYFCTDANVALHADISNGDVSAYSFQWYNEQQIIPDATDATLTVNQTGTYSVAIINNTSNCVTLNTFTTEESGIAVIDNAKVSYASDLNTVSISASGLGIYEYALYTTNQEQTNHTLYRDYQSNPVFNNVQPGIYTARVKDIKNDCGIAETVVYVVGFTKFFTPNNDGYNDTFKIEGASEVFMASSNVYIFNRYGKLLKQITLNDSSWDGTFNGQNLPEDDYWFTATLADGRNFKTHFTLRR
ncbi:T9SS type B sorting domain-containing protein [Formosa sp. A9]|uniref:T9SS type B sorting domain-containing protein n=1 Tax=Formosa sp. A9 TaxID=3442641 RepID=UPI003EB86FA1